MSDKLYQEYKAALEALPLGATRKDIVDALVKVAAAHDAKRFSDALVVERDHDDPNKLNVTMPLEIAKEFGFKK